MKPNQWGTHDEFRKRRETKKAHDADEHQGKREPKNGDIPDEWKRYGG